MMVGATRFSACIANLSTRGLLILAERQVPVGRTVKIELDDGRMLEGRVCWSNVRQLGVALTMPLAADDALWLHVVAPV